MSKRFFFLFLWMMMAGVVLSQYSPLQSKAILLKRMIQLHHYSPRAVDDSFSLNVFHHIIDEVDDSRIYLTDAEYRQLAGFSLKIDDELNGNGWGFTDQLGAILKKALMRADTIIDKTAPKPFDFSANESVTSTREKKYFFSADVNALKERWTRRLKYRTLEWIYEDWTGDSTHKMSFKNALAAKEATTKQKIRQSEKKNIARVLNAPQGYDAYITEIYLGAIAHCFDPHTDFFSVQSGEKFQAELSTETLDFGIGLDENDKGQIVIAVLLPGGPAWKSGELHEGDVLQSLQWEGKEAVDMSEASVDEAEDIIDQSTKDRMVFKFKKTDGTPVTVLLRKEKVENDDNIVKGFVLSGEKKIGYILLPGFYTEWENESGSGCANDVAKEILRLKKEGIEGLILDVRYNGGGSVGEALDMAGIFIDEGPLAAEKLRDGKQITLKDPNRGTIYDGPLALMVNGQSASASELVAATLQDYNRAVIIGSKTYGKATGQAVFSLDTISKKAEPAPGKESVKITVEKLYRVTGGSAQFTGVIPDVLLPDAFDALHYREEFEENALKPDTGKRNNYYKPLPALPVATLVQKSSARVNSNYLFNEVKKAIGFGKKLWDAGTITIPLSADGYEKWMKEEELSDQKTDDNWKTKIFSAGNHADDKEIFKNNAYAREINDVWLKNIESDFYLEEAFLVLSDLINLQKTAAKN